MLIAVHPIKPIKHVKFKPILLRTLSERIIPHPKSLEFLPHPQR